MSSRYPAELEEALVLRDGSRLRLRPIQAADADRLRAFFDTLSERSRYQRFLQHMKELPPDLLARFTQLDYERELALVALDGEHFVAVGRSAPNDDGVTAEFGLVVADAWQAKGIGRALLQRLCDAAKRAGYQALYGHILDANHEMLQLAARLGFVQAGRNGAELSVVRRL